MGGRRCLLPSASKRLRKSAAAGAGAEGSQAGAQDGVIGSEIAGLDARKATNNTSLEAEVDEWDKVPDKITGRNIADVSCTLVAGNRKGSCARCAAKGRTCEHQLGGNFAQVVHMHLYKGSNLTIIGPDSRRKRENAKNREDRD
ncbi:hypothetical protein I316_05400 [Kwoniella heveanensis BCC8398]|uniref:Uncharacterized protein n=1 Tax=Kwoniella heveanensis BCC8398 TaxID=1296120 RepID=A0A1B9GPX9_9TREE|nr:hypothetical protein I316_05400 [Kwoniella heveanensis BCC8398]